MSLLTFLRDRLLMIVAYFISIVLAVLIIELDVFQSGLNLRKENIVYIFVLAFVVLAFFLAIDFLRRLPFYREIKKAQKTVGLDRALALQSAVTKEQKMIQELVHENYRDYMKDLVDYQEQQERHDHFTNHWVHSMKTPVSVINLLLQEGGEVKSVDEARILLKSVGEENERLAHGLEMVLHTARLDKFELDVSLKRVDLVGIVRNVINELKKAMIRYTIFPKLVCNEEVVYVETDQKWLTFIIKQLTTNAMKYTPEGENRKIVYEISKRNDECVVSVRDEGVGIPVQDLPRVFDPFFTGENGRKEAEATGMGLYLTKEVCNRLGHSLSIDSEEGRGTTVSIGFSSESIHRETLGSRR